MRADSVSSETSDAGAEDSGAWCVGVGFPASHAIHELPRMVVAPPTRKAEFRLPIEATLQRIHMAFIPPNLPLTWVRKAPWRERCIKERQEETR